MQRKLPCFSKQALHVNPPAIPFIKKVKKKASFRTDFDIVETATKTVKVPINSTGPDSETIEVKMPGYEEGTT
jgi:hypothetical protein